jgi:hypothetical protein
MLARTAGMSNKIQSLAEKQAKLKMQLTALA